MLRASAQHVIVTPLSGSDDVELAHDPAVPMATLLEIDDLTILVDCGAPQDFGSSVVDAIRPYASKIDAILITSPELRCCGSLPLVLRLVRPEVTIVGTIAAAKLGLMSTVCHLLDRHSTGDAEVDAPVTVAEIHAAFKRIREVQYKQDVELVSISGNRDGLASARNATVKALPSGRVVGGAVFCVSRTKDDICIALNATPEATAQASVQGFDAPRNATIVIADAGLISRAEPRADVTRSETRDELMKVIRNTSRRGGSVLIPVDTFARGAELIVTLSKIFAAEGLHFPLVFACPRAAPFSDRLRTMSEFLMKDLFNEDQADAFPGVIMARSVEAVEAVAGGRCVIAHCMDHGAGGLAAALLPAVLRDKLSCVVLPGGTVAPRGSNIRRLIDMAGATTPAAKKIDRWTYRRMRLLEGAELAAYYDDVAARRGAAIEAAAAGAQGGVDRVMLANDAAAVWSDEDDDQQSSTAGAPAATAKGGAAAPKGKASTAAAAPPPPPSAVRLFLPSRYPSFTSAFTLFPPVVLQVPPSALAFAAASDASATMRSVYGEPLVDADVKRFREHITTHQYEETALSDAQLVHTALQEDSVPAIVKMSTVTDLKVEAAIHIVDWTGLPTAETYRALLAPGGNLNGPRKVVLLHGTPQETADAREWCINNAVVKAENPEGSIVAPSLLSPVDVATPVYTFEARVDQSLLNRRFAAVPSRNGNWSLGWVAGSVAVDVNAQRMLDRPEEVATKRHRAERPAHDDDAASRAADLDIKRRAAMPSFVRPTRDAAATLSHDVGSVFVGDVDLRLVQRDVSSSGTLLAELADTVLIVGDGIAVRRRAQGGQVACEAAACPEQFSIRSLLYKQLGCVL